MTDSDYIALSYLKLYHELGKEHNKVCQRLGRARKSLREARIRFHIERDKRVKHLSQAYSDVCRKNEKLAHELYLAKQIITDMRAKR